MRRGRTVTAALAAALIALAAAAADADEGYACSGGVGLIEVRSARLQTRGVLSVGLAGRYFESDDLSGSLGAGTGRYGALHASATYGALPWLEVAFDAALRGAAWDSDAGGVDARGLSNPVVGIKMGPPPGDSPLAAALWFEASIPAATEVVVRDTSSTDILLAGGEGVDATAALLLTVDFTPAFPLRLHANAGWRFNGSEDQGRRFFPDSYPPLPSGAGSVDNDFAVLRGAVEFPGRDVDLFTEFRADLFADRDAIALKENPLMVTPGLRLRFGDGWSVTAAVSVSISGDDAATPEFDPHEAWPDWVATVSIAHAWPVASEDTDGDGIPDYRDECPGHPEDRDGFEDDDGCPDPDNDGDGIPDGVDLAPLVPEDFDGFEDGDGVPDLDNDRDGIIDERDMCPDEPEDLDGFEDEDGCPDD